MEKRNRKDLHLNHLVFHRFLHCWGSCLWKFLSMFPFSFGFHLRSEWLKQEAQWGQLLGRTNDEVFFRQFIVFFPYPSLNLLRLSGCRPAIWPKRPWSLFNLWICFLVFVVLELIYWYAKGPPPIYFKALFYICLLCSTLILVIIHLVIGRKLYRSNRQLNIYFFNCIKETKLIMY